MENPAGFKNAGNAVAGMTESAAEAPLEIPEFTDEEIEDQVDRAIERFKKNIDRIFDQ